ncbi:uncharacterized protein LOC127749646 [Frankliniella occidentalis]|uniref:Uncharacterized protein LOC127749646 n=1 Tax=Frankliniella occidentalis TaxID=133901 RepID=A0A9C6WZB6_FRAOC|nr:uncharacterized protein LOC127749646 [Frankliniella occidentalis]
METALALLVVIAVLLVDNSAQFDFTKANFEAAFQGRCGRESPCEQLCFELHDGMFECECREGYVLHLNGYGCLDPEQQKIWHRFPDSVDACLLMMQGSPFKREGPSSH